MEVKPGDSMEIICTVTGHPFPSAGWYRDEQVIPMVGEDPWNKESVRSEFNETSHMKPHAELKLTLGEALRSATYQCRAQSEVDSHAAEIRVKVMGKWSRYR